MKRMIAILLLLVSIPGSIGSVRGQTDAAHPIITPANADQVEQLGILGFGWIQEVAWSPDGVQVAAASSIGILLYDSEGFDTAPYERLPVPEQMVFSVAYSPDGSLLASVSGPYSWEGLRPMTVRLWDTVTHTIRADWSLETAWPDLEFSPDGHQLMLYSDYNRTTFLWDVSNPSQIQPLAELEHDAVIAAWYPALDLDTLDFVDLSDQVATAYSRDHRWAAGITADGIVRVWNVEQRSEQYAIDIHDLGEGVHPSQRPTLEFSPTGSFLMVFYAGYSGQCGGGYGVWDTETGEEYFWNSECVGPMVVSPDEQHILTLSYYGNLASVWDRTSTQHRVVLGNIASQAGAAGNLVMSLAFRPGTDELAVVRHNAVEIWDTTTQTRITSLSGPDYELYPQVAFSTDGSVLAVYGQTGARFYDMETYALITTLEDVHVEDITFSPDGRLLMVEGFVRRESGPSQSMLTLWNVEEFLARGQNEIGMDDARLLFTPDGSMASSDSVVFSADGTRLATGAAVGEIGVVVWDVEAVLAAREIELHTHDDLPDAVIGYIPITTDARLIQWMSVAFSPDGHSLTVNNVIYDTDTWTERFTLTGHTGAVTSVAFSPNGDIIATSSGSTEGWFSNEAPEVPDDTIRLWDAHMGDPLAVLQGHTEGIWQVVFNADGTMLASGSGATISTDMSLDGTVRLWGIP